MDLYDLTPNEFMAYHYIKSRVISGESYTRTGDIALVLKCSVSTAKRVVASLIQKGCISRTMRSLYVVELLEPSGELKRLTHEPHIGKAIDRLVDNSSNPSNEVLEEAVTRQDPSPVEGVTVRYYDDDDNLAAIGQLEDVFAPKTKTKTRTSGRKQYLKPANRDAWTMRDVGMDFKHRLLQRAVPTTDAWKSPIIGVGEQGAKLTKALYTWQQDYGITAQEAATLLDEFFESPEVNRMTNEFPPYQLFLHYIKVNVDRLRSKTVASNHLEEIGGQVLPW